MSQHMTPTPVTDRSRFGPVRVRILTAIGMAIALVLASSQSAAAHTGDDAEFGHIFLEFALWGIGLAAFVGLLIAVFWVRARVLRHDG